MLLDIALVYLVGALAIIALFRWAIRNEPTAHGQIVGRQMGCLIGIFWPIALPYIAVVGSGFLIAKAWKRIRGER